MPKAIEMLVVIEANLWQLNPKLILNYKFNKEKDGFTSKKFKILKFDFILGKEFGETGCTIESGSSKRVRRRAAHPSTSPYERLKV